MKPSSLSIVIGFYLCLILSSCNDKDHTGFSIEFSDGSAIIEKNISFYDSSTNILFLQDNIILPEIKEFSNYNYPKFKVFINDEMLYEGIIYHIASMISPSPYFILEQFEPAEVIPILFTGLNAAVPDARNDQRIIDYLGSKNLLYNGISCSLDSVFVHSYTYSSVTCTITLKNNDNVNYYIPDPEKMGAERFDYYVGGVILRKIETNEVFQAKIENATIDWNNITMEHLSLLESNGTITFTYTITLDSQVSEGTYKCDLVYGRMNPFGPEIPTKLALDQKDGRVWIGGTNSTLDNIDF